MAGAPIGNQNAARAKLWQAAIERAVARLGGAPAPGDDRSDFVKGMDSMADQFVAQSKVKDPIAFFREFGDRLDGKPALAITGPDGGPLQIFITATQHDEKL